MKEKREWWEWVLIVLLIVMLSLATYDCIAQSPQEWQIVNEELLSDTCEFEISDNATTIINGQEIAIDKRMLNKELILVTWSNGADTRYSIREIYEKEIYKDIKHVLREFNKMTDVLKDYPDALNAITNEYLNVLWYEQKY